MTRRRRARRGMMMISPSFTDVEFELVCLTIPPFSAATCYYRYRQAIVWGSWEGYVLIICYYDVHNGSFRIQELRTLMALFVRWEPSS